MKIYLALPALALLFSCSSVKDTAVTEQPGQDTTAAQPISQHEKINADTHFIKGVAAFEAGDYEKSVDLLSYAYSKMPDKSGIQYALMDSYLKTGDVSSAIYYGQMAVENSPENKWYRLKLSEAYRQAGRFSETVAELHNILEISPADADILFLIAGIETRRGNFEESNEAYQRLINIIGPDRSIYYQMFQNYSAMEDQEKALEQLENIRELDPGNTSILQTLSQFYLETNQIDKALEMLEKALEIKENDPEILISLADIYISQGNWNDAGEILTQIISNPDVSVNNKAEILQYVLSRYSTNTDDAIISELTTSLTEIMLDMHGDEGYIHAVLGDFYTIRSEYEQAIYHLKRTTELMPSNDAAWRQLLQTLYTAEQYDKVITTGLEADEAVPDDAFIQFFIGGAYMMNDRNEEAVEWLQRASEMPSRRPFRSVITGTLGDAYASLEQWEEADEAYEMAIRLDADNDVALNNYAYYLSERDMELEKAKEMSRKALDMNPDNAAYLDTMGWIYFKMGEYEQAKEYIRASLDTGSASATVLEHMGDVYEKLGDMDSARLYWQRAFEEDNSRTYLKEKLPGI